MNRLTSLVVIVAFATAAVTSGGCGSEYTIVDRSTLRISENSRIAASSVLPGGQKLGRATNHLALAKEVYSKQLYLLKERRNKVRARRRALNLVSYGVLASVAITAGALALGSDTPDVRRAAGGTAIAGAAMGTGLQIGALMQEDVAVIDGKIRHLQALYDAMEERVRVLAALPQSDETDAAIGAAIESFINEALQINVKG